MVLRSKSPFWELNCLWKGPHGREIRTAPSSSQHPLRSEEPRSYNCKGMDSANILNEFGSTCFLSQASRWQCQPDDSLLATLWECEQRTHLNCAQALIIKTEEKKIVLLDATKFVTSFYSEIKNVYMYIISNWKSPTLMVLNFIIWPPQEDIGNLGHYTHSLCPIW